MHLSLPADGNCCQVGEVQLLEPAAEGTQLASEHRVQKGRVLLSFILATRSIFSEDKTFTRKYMKVVQVAFRGALDL